MLGELFVCKELVLRLAKAAGVPRHCMNASRTTAHPQMWQRLPGMTVNMRLCRADRATPTPPSSYLHTSHGTRILPRILFYFLC